jgi:hypothetical protein
VSEPNATRREWIGLGLARPRRFRRRVAAVGAVAGLAIIAPGRPASTEDTARSTPTVLSN